MDPSPRRDPSAEPSDGWDPYPCSLCRPLVAEYEAARAWLRAFARLDLGERRRTRDASVRSGPAWEAFRSAEEAYAWARGVRRRTDADESACPECGHDLDRIREELDRTWLEIRHQREAWLPEATTGREAQPRGS